jgi:hypothetical protein
VLEDLPPDMADYKGITALRPRITGWLRRHAPARP